MVICETTSLLDQGGGKAVSVGLVVGELSIHVVKDLNEVSSISATRNRHSHTFH